MKRLHNICLVVMLALALCLCGCSGRDFTLPAQIDLLPGQKTSLIDVADYVGDGETTADEMLALMAQMQSNPEMFAFSFASDSPKIASVDENGIVYGHTVGEATVTAVCEPLEFYAEVVVRVRDYAATLEVPNALYLELGTDKVLGAKLSSPSGAVPGNDRPLQYVSADPAVVTVDEEGVLQPRESGTTAVTVSVPGSSLREVCIVTVGDAVQSVSLTSAEAALDPGERMVLVAGVWPVLDEVNIAWHSADQSVATVNGGMVTAVGAGTTQITATASGKTAVCTVTVSGPATPETATEAVEPALPERPETKLAADGVTTEATTPDETAEPEKVTEQSALDIINRELNSYLGEQEAKLTGKVPEPDAEGTEKLPAIEVVDPAPTATSVPAAATSAPAPAATSAPAAAAAAGEEPSALEVMGHGPVVTATPETAAPTTDPEELPALQYLGHGPVVTASPETAAPATEEELSALRLTGPGPVVIATPETATPETATPETATPEAATPEAATPESAAPSLLKQVGDSISDFFGGIFSGIAGLFGK